MINKREKLEGWSQEEIVERNLEKSYMKLGMNGTQALQARYALDKKLKKMTKSKAKTRKMQ